MKTSRVLLWVVPFALLTAAAGGWYFSHHDQPETSPTELAEGALAPVKVPDSLTDQEQLGKRAYDAVCAAPVTGPMVKGRTASHRPWCM